MLDHFAAHWRPTIKNRPARTRRRMIGAAIITPLLLIGVLGSARPDAPQDSGLLACTYPLSTHDVPAADYRKIRAQFAGSRWPDLRNAGTAYVDPVPACPGEDCPMCNGSTCNKCGAGCWNSSAGHCPHDVVERHARPEYAVRECEEG